MTTPARQPRRLESYVSGRWMPGSRDGQPLRDAATGAVVATIDSTGVDFAGALAYGREVAGPKLRALSFHDRAGMLKALGLRLMELKEDFYTESLHTGATRADGWIDIEGGIGTMLIAPNPGRNGHGAYSAIHSPAPVAPPPNARASGWPRCRWPVRPN